MMGWSAWPVVNGENSGEYWLAAVMWICESEKRDSRAKKRKTLILSVLDYAGSDGSTT
jgi:hypothetical protein